MTEIINTDILVAGGGSAGFGAAYAACLHSKGRYTVAVIDKNEILGGTSTAGGVNIWEMGIGGPGVHTHLAKKLLTGNGQAAIIKGNWKPLIRTRPYALHTPNDGYSYEDTLCAAGVYDRVNNHNSFIFEPEAMAEEMLKLIRENGGSNFTFYKKETITGVRISENRISEVHTNKHIFKPTIIIDCTGDIIVSRMAGCETEKGSDVNGVTQVYRVTPKGYKSIDAVPKQYLPPYSDPVFEKRLDEVRVISSINAYPNEDLNINQLPTMDGDEFFSMERNNAEEICKGRVYLHWRRMQQDSPLMRKYKISKVFPMTGVRESHRLNGLYKLNAADVLNGFDNQNMKEEVIAFSDHPIDIHGGDHPGIRILDKPYGIPYSCLLPKNISNMLVACRGSSYDQVAAASCRLSRTMISLGEAAGCAAEQCMTKSISFHDIAIEELQEKLGIPDFIENVLSDKLV